MVAVKQISALLVSLAVLTVVLVAASSCTTRGARLRIGAIRPQRTPTCDLLIYDGPTTLPYDRVVVLGFVEAGAYQDAEALEIELRRQGCALGADALIEIERFDTHSGLLTEYRLRYGGNVIEFSGTVSRGDYLTAIAVSFIDGAVESHTNEAPP